MIVNNTTKQTEASAALMGSHAGIMVMRLSVSRIKTEKTFNSAITAILNQYT